MSDSEGDFEASSDDVYEVDVVLLDGTVKKNYPILTFNKVHEEKKRIWTKEIQVGPPELIQLGLILIDPYGKEKLMDDNKDVGYYVDDFANSKIKFVRRS